MYLAVDQASAGRFPVDGPPMPKLPVSQETRARAYDAVAWARPMGPADPLTASWSHGIGLFIARGEYE